MPTRTVSAAGGNFNTGTTWVGGVPPIVGDDIVANASSGNLNLTNLTPSLLGADFTGYTGTLSFNSFQMIFNTAGATSIIISPTMTITTVTGFFNIGRSLTLTSSGKSLPIRYNASGTTLTLVGDLTISLLSGAMNGTITGADVILTVNSPTDLSALTIASGRKMFWRPLASASMINFVVPQGYFVFDTTNQITVA
jgi:hypothetical protein